MRRVVAACVLCVSCSGQEPPTTLSAAAEGGPILEYRFEDAAGLAYDGAVQIHVSTAEHPGPGIGLIHGSVVTHAWQHIAGIYDGSELRIYVNGIDTCERIATSGAIQDNSTINPTSAPIGIGSDSVTVPALNFAGGIDDLRVHLDVLDTSSLAAGFFSGVADPCEPAGDVDDGDDAGDDDDDDSDEDDDSEGDHDDGDDDDDPPETTVSVVATDVSTLSGAEALATDPSCSLFAKSLQDPAGTPVQVAKVIGGSTTVLGTHSALRNSDVSGIAIDPMTGKLIIADEIGGAGGRIALIDLDSQAVSTAFDLPWILNPMSNGTGQQQYAHDHGTSILYFWDSTQSAVYRLDRATGALSTVLAVDQGVPVGQHFISYVNDLVFDEISGTLLLADSSTGTVLEIDPSVSPATVTTLFSGVATPHAIALDPDGTNVYVASAFQSILVGSRSGGELSVLSDGYPFVTDIAACGSSVFAVDKSLDSIFEIIVSDDSTPCGPGNGQGHGYGHGKHHSNGHGHGHDCDE